MARSRTPLVCNRVNRSARGGTRHRVARVSPAHTSRWLPLGPCYRQRKTRSNPLCEDQDVRRNVVVVHREPLAHPSKPTLHLISDQQDLVPVAEVPQSSDEGRWRRHVPSLSLPRLNNHVCATAFCLRPPHCANEYTVTPASAIPMPTTFILFMSVSPKYACPARMMPTRRTASVTAKVRGETREM